MQYIIGIDEVGRGPLAGPVVVAAVVLPRGFRLPKEMGALKDSKQLSKQRREVWCEYFITCPEVSFSVSRVYPNRIDRLNISGAANQAALRAYQKLLSREHIHSSHRVILDGGLYLGTKKKSFEYGAKTIIKGDEKHPPIMIASIIAKVVRDRYMTKLAKKYPEYGFEEHKGYGTREHRKVLKKYGPTEAHRLTFLSKYPTIWLIKES